jgi:aminobenzoyl-glutamate utilization protein A
MTDADQAEGDGAQREAATAEPPDWLVDLRRDLHRRPEPAWREFYTTARLLDAVEALGIDDLSVAVGPDALSLEDRSGVPDEEDLQPWRERAREAGVSEDRLETMAAGATGLVARLDRGEGPHVALRVDIDGLPVEESTSEAHAPAAGGYRSVHEGAMHACGHDAHATIGVGTLAAVAESDFEGTVTVCFQPAEEVIGGGRAIARSGHLDGVDDLLAIHVGLDHPTGEVVAGMTDFLAVRQFRAEFEGATSHAGGHPERGRNAVQAMASAVGNLYAIPRHADGATRVNAGRVGGGTATNVVPAEAFVEGEVRGVTTDLMEYASEHADRILEGAAATHDCSVSVETTGEAPSAASDEALRTVVREVAGETAGVDSVLDRAPLGGSEDATFLMRRVQEGGGRASFVCIGTDHPGGHHTGTFDVDERTLGIGVDVLTGAVRALADAAGPDLDPDPDGDAGPDR